MQGKRAVLAAKTGSRISKVRVSPATITRALSRRTQQHLPLQRNSAVHSQSAALQSALTCPPACHDTQHSHVQSALPRICRLGVDMPRGSHRDLIKFLYQGRCLCGKLVTRTAYFVSVLLFYSGTLRLLVLDFPRRSPARR